MWRSSQRWDSGHHDLTPWYQYSLSVMVHAYEEFESRVGELMTAPGAKSRSVQWALEAYKPGQMFTIADLERACPTVSRATIRRVLNEMREQGRVECLGTGRWAKWRVILT